MHPNEERINEYVDGALGDGERAEIARHLAECASCRALADDLRELTTAARALAPVEPPATAWRRIEPAIRLEARSAHRKPPHPARIRRIRYAAYALATAAIVVLATSVGLRMSPGSKPGAAPTAPAGQAAQGDAAQSVEAELRAAEAHYDNAIKGLEQIANANQGSLDPGTAATLQKNLSVIDQAISESRAAVRAQPNSEPAQQSLLENFRTKVAVLQDTVALINEMRKGNEAGAARIVSGLKQKSE